MLWLFVLLFPLSLQAQEVLLGAQKPLALHNAARAIAAKPPELWIGRGDGRAIVYRYDTGRVYVREIANGYINSVRWDQDKLTVLTQQGLFVESEPFPDYSSRISTLGCYPYQASDVTITDRVYIACEYAGVFSLDPDARLTSGVACEDKPMIAKSIRVLGEKILVVDSGCLNIWQYSNARWSYFSGYRYMYSQIPNTCPENWIGTPVTRLPLPVSAISVYDNRVYTVGGSYGLVAEIVDGVITRSWCLDKQAQIDYSSAVIEATRDMIFVAVPKAGALISIGRATPPAPIPSGQQTWCSFGKAITQIFCRY